MPVLRQHTNGDWYLRGYAGEYYTYQIEDIGLDFLSSLGIDQDGDYIDRALFSDLKQEKYIYIRGEGTRTNNLSHDPYAAKEIWLTQQVYLEQKADLLIRWSNENPFGTPYEKMKESLVLYIRASNPRISLYECFSEGFVYSVLNDCMDECENLGSIHQKIVEKSNVRALYPLRSFLMQIINIIRMNEQQDNTLEIIKNIIEYLNDRTVDAVRKYCMNQYFNHDSQVWRAHKRLLFNKENNKTVGEIKVLLSLSFRSSEQIYTYASMFVSPKFSCSNLWDAMAEMVCDMNGAWDECFTNKYIEAKTESEYFCKYLVHVFNSCAGVDCKDLFWLLDSRTGEDCLELVEDGLFGLTLMLDDLPPFPGEGKAMMINAIADMIMRHQRYRRLPSQIRRTLRKLKSNYPKFTEDVDDLLLHA